MKIEIDGVTVPINNFSEEDYEAVAQILRERLKDRSCKNRDAIKDAFTEAVRRGPKANPSDLWHHVVYRLYMTMIQEPDVVACRGQIDPGQSWKRAGGDAFELFLVDYYNPLLAGKGIYLVSLMSRKLQEAAQQLFEVQGEIGRSKLDIAIVSGHKPGGGLPLRKEDMIGVIHAKVSLAERISDDVPASRALMKRGYCSFLVTLDVKSFPPSGTVGKTRAYMNRGELGTPAKPTDKRLYIERDGEFNACFSFNHYTVPSPAQTISGKRIFVSGFEGQWDQLCEAIVTAHRRRHPAV